MNTVTTKADLAEMVAKNVAEKGIDINPAVVKLIINELIATIKRQLSQKKTVMLKGFGCFMPRYFDEKSVQNNLAGGKVIKVLGRTLVKWKSYFTVD